MEQLTAVIHRITFHDPQTGASVLKVTSNHYRDQEFAVIVNYPNPHAGSTMEFSGDWVTHPKFGRQFKATGAVEQRPATLGAMEKYIGSGLIKGVGPKMAKKIVKKFGMETLNIFDKNPNRLLDINGINENKLKSILHNWDEQNHIREIMLFLQRYNVSTLLCVKIFKVYEKKSVQKIKDDPYCLARDIHGIGFKTADRIALSMGLMHDAPPRILAGIRHVLDEARSLGHCYLNLEQITLGTIDLLEAEFPIDIPSYLSTLLVEKQICHRLVRIYDKVYDCYYARSLFFEEYHVAKFIQQSLGTQPEINKNEITQILDELSTKTTTQLSGEQYNAVVDMCAQKLSILTGGPGCGKTTTTKALVAVLRKLGKEILLAAPTGRAAQRMSEVIGLKAQTIHRLLVYNPQNHGFVRNQDNPLEGDVLIVDECSMLDISLTSSLFKAIPTNMQVILIGDPDQLPSVGAGNVLRDCIDSKKIPTFCLTQIFRQAQGSRIIQYAHEINKGLCPKMDTPLEFPQLWSTSADCMFIDSDEITQEQTHMIHRVRHFFLQLKNRPEDLAYIQKKGKGDLVKEIQQVLSLGEDEFNLQVIKELNEAQKSAHQLLIPQKFSHMNPLDFLQSQDATQELKYILKKIHPFSTLNYGLTAHQMLIKLYGESIPKYKSTNNKKPEIQILCPMIKGSLGTLALNSLIQSTFNPKKIDSQELIIGNHTFRVGDRVIQKRNNYDLNVFNGDIGNIIEIDMLEKTMAVEFPSRTEGDIVIYKNEQILDIDLAYAITIHKSQGSEFDVVIIPIFNQHFTMLFRNLVYTGLTRAKKLCLFLGSRKALAMATRNVDSRQRQTALKKLIQEK